MTVLLLALLDCFISVLFWTRLPFISLNLLCYLIPTSLSFSFFLPFLVCDPTVMWHRQFMHWNGTWRILRWLHSILFYCMLKKTKEKPRQAWQNYSCDGTAATALLRLIGKKSGVGYGNTLQSWRRWPRNDNWVPKGNTQMMLVCFLDWEEEILPI